MMLYFPFIYFSILTWLLKRKHRGQWEISSLLACLYAFSALCSIPTYLMDLREWSEMMPTIHILPTLTYCLLLTITILPFSGLHTEEIQKIGKPNMKVFNLFSWMMIFTFFITLINLGTDIKAAFIDGDWHAMRNAVYGNNTVKPTGIKYLLSIPETLLSPCSPIAIVSFFYSLCYLQKSKTFNILLLLSSLTPILPAILIAGRTQITYWFLIFIFSYLFFKNHLSPKKKQAIYLVLVILGSAALTFTSIVAISRWGENNAVSDMILLYAGEPFLFFCHFFDKYTFVSPHFLRLFPFFHYFILGDKTDLMTYRESIEMVSGMDIGIFYTFLGDMMVDFGKVGMVLYVLIYNCITRRAIAKHDTTYPYYKLLILTICILVPLEGVFYYSFHTVRMSYYIIWTFLLCLIHKKHFSPDESEETKKEELAL